MVTSINVEIRRLRKTALSVCGEMWINSVFGFYTLEPAQTNPVIVGHPLIPAGQFKVQLTLSPHLGYITPEVIDVPGRSAIRWHIGNRPQDVEGCTAVGMMRSEDFVGESIEAFGKMFSMLNKPFPSIVVTYRNLF